MMPYNEVTQKQYSIEFELRLKNRWWNRPQSLMVARSLHGRNGPERYRNQINAAIISQIPAGPIMGNDYV